MTSTSYDIVILPSPAVAKKLIDASAELHARDTLFTLDGINVHPHVSLYMARIAVGNIKRVSALLQTIAATAPIFNLEGLRYDQGHGYLGVAYQRTEPLDRLQAAVVDGVNPLRDNMLENANPRMLTAVGLEKENWERYGYEAIGELFRPHATITRFALHGTVDVALLPEPANFSGDYTRLALFEMGDHGTCVQEIASYPLR